MKALTPRRPMRELNTSERRHLAPFRCIPDICSASPRPGQFFSSRLPLRKAFFHERSDHATD